MSDSSELEGEVDHSFFDSDFDDNCISSNGRGKMEQDLRIEAETPPAHLKAGSQPVSASHTDNSEDTVTDVSPLSSPDCSPPQSVDLNHRGAEEGSQIEQQEEQESVPPSGLSDIHQEEESDEDSEYYLSSSSQLGTRLFHRPRGRNRKNYSFTNDEVQCIDRENQHLFRKLSLISSGSGPQSSVGKKTPTTSASPVIRLPHSAVNRRREQQRIERENLAFLKRLESIKPTPSLKRSQQLADYQRQREFAGASPLPIGLSTTKRVTPTSRTPVDNYRPVSSRRHSSGAICTSTDSKSTPVPRSIKPKKARPVSAEKTSDRTFSWTPDPRFPGSQNKIIK